MIALHHTSLGWEAGESTVCPIITTMRIVLNMVLIEPGVRYDKGLRQQFLKS